MGLLEELAAERRGRDNRTCQVARAIDQLPDTDQPVMWGAVLGDIVDPVTGVIWSAGAICRVFKARGTPIDRNSVARHRRGECRACGQ